MKVIIFGATGTIGRLVLKEALAAGHEVTAFARRPHKLEIQHPSLIRQSGDATIATAVADAIKGHDAVVITLGAGMSRKSRIRSLGTANIIAGMKQHGIERLICQSTLGAHESWENLNFFWKRIMFGGLLAPVFKDHERQEAWCAIAAWIGRLYARALLRTQRQVDNTKSVLAPKSAALALKSAAPMSLRF